MPFMPPQSYQFLLCPCSITRLHVDCNTSSRQSKLMKFGSLDDMTLHYSSDFDEITVFLICASILRLYLFIDLTPIGFVMNTNEN
jgi:hypothetical protein